MRAFASASAGRDVCSETAPDSPDRTTDRNAPTWRCCPGSGNTGANAGFTARNPLKQRKCWIRFERVPIRDAARGNPGYRLRTRDHGLAIGDGREGSLIGGRSPDLAEAHTNR